MHRVALNVSCRRTSSSWPGGRPVDANAHDLVAVAVAALGELLIAQSASEGALSSVRAHVIFDITKFAELFLAGEALEDLVLPACLFIGTTGLPVALIFLNHAVPLSVELSRPQLALRELAAVEIRLIGLLCLRGKVARAHFWVLFSRVQGCSGLRHVLLLFNSCIR